MKNVLLIGIDTLRASNLSAYGYPRVTSPFMDKMAREGILFKNCLAPAIPTHPGWTTILSGTHPLKHGIVSHMGHHTLGPEVPWFPEILRENGYYTIAVDNLKLWFTRGFDEYIDSGKTNKEGLGGLIDEIGDITAEKVNSLAIAKLNELNALNKKGKPFFMFLHYWDTHVPYAPPEPFKSLYYEGDEKSPLYRGIEKVKIMSPLWFQFREWLKDVRDDEYVRAMYDSEINYVDAAIKDLIYNMENKGLFENTLIVITSDHGESLGEHDVFFDHQTVYNHDIHVPLIFSNVPAKFRKTIVLDHCDHSDIAPTILEMIGLKREKKMTGHSLLAHINQKKVRRKKADERPFLSIVNTWNSKIAIIVGRYKLITTMKDYDLYGKPPGYVELYDLILDPNETVNIAKPNEKIVKKLQNIQNSFIQQLVGSNLNPFDDEPISLRGKVDKDSTFYSTNSLKIKKNVCDWRVPSPEEIRKFKLF